ncbi:ATP-binding cassette domain-containing protein [Streptomyces anulatus]|uniref:ATP-binding cassette domain-containing protein n=1 Tax=Streptomyces anulatus TaxID=1892 RepID=UPI000A414603
MKDDESQPRRTVPRETDARPAVPRETDPERTVPRETDARPAVPRETDPERTVPRETDPRRTAPRETDPPTPGAPHRARPTPGATARCAGSATRPGPSCLAGRPLTGLLWLAVAAVAVLPAVLAARGVFGRLADLVEPLRDGLVRRAVSRALSGALAHSAGDAGTRSLSQVTHQSEIARDGWAGLVLTLRSFVFTAAGAVAGLLALSPVLLLIVLPPLVLGAALFLGTLPPMAARQRDYLAADEAYAAHAGRLAASVRDIAAAGAAERTVAESRTLAGAQLAASRSLARWSGVRVLALAVCGRFPPLLLLLGAPWLLRNGLTPGALVGALTYLTQALAPAVQALMTMLGTAGGRLVVVLDRFTDAPPPPAEDPPPARDAEPPPRGTPVAELHEVSFAYGPGAQPVLDRLSLTIEAGEHLAVVGPSGSGKSTLAAVLAGTERPTGGAVRWRGRPARPADATSVRVLLPQHAYVFSGSLRENLRYLRPDARDREIAAMADALGLDALLSRLGSLDADVEPDRLSQGERQLIALGRAYLAAPPLLILDEATSRLDPAAETRAELAFAALPGALVVVAHRLSSARRAGRTLVMDGPRTQCGTPDELLRSCALYRDLAGRWEPEQPDQREEEGRGEERGIRSTPPPSPV